MINLILFLSLPSSLILFLSCFLCERYLIDGFGNEEQLNKPNNDYGQAVKESDVWITAWGSKNSRSKSNIDPKILQKRRLANKSEK